MAFNLGDALRGVSKSGTDREQIEYIRLDLVQEDPNNFYKLDGIDELAANIELCGLQQPIRVRPISGGNEQYMIVSGHRRRKAVELLAEDAPDRWSEIPCIVEDDAVSPALQQLRLIYANASTRKLTDPEIAEQAAQVKKLLYQLKEEEGYEFPGRMRDHVAEAVGASKSKLARLEVIQNKLAAAWQPVWKSGTLAENTAYELAKMPVAWQIILFEEKTRTNANLKYLYTDDVKKFAERAAAIECFACPCESDGCENAESKIRKAAVFERWGWFNCDSKCCKDCPEMDRCKRCCPKLAEAVKQKKLDAKEKAKAEAEAQAQQDKPVIDQISALWQRFGLARETASQDFKSCKETMKVYALPYDETAMMKLECGETKITAQTKLPFGYTCYLSDIQKLIALADLFECSLDWLLCRTDIKEMASESYSDTASKSLPMSAGWYTADVEPAFGSEVIVVTAMGYVDNGKYVGSGVYSGLIDDQDPVSLWTYMPKDAGIVSPAPSGWRTGSPEAYGTYAAYVQVTGAANPMLRELLWTGEEWLMFGQKISDDVTVKCWAERPEV